MVNSFPAPDFIDRDPSVIDAAAIAKWEELSEKPLYPAQVERLLIQLLSYRETLVRIAIQYAAEQNLVNFAEGDRLDQLGALTDTARLQPTKARTTIRFTLNAPRFVDTVIGVGTQIGSGNSDLIFTTIESKTIFAGQTTVDAIAECSTVGAIGNGFAVNAFQDLLTTIPGLTLTGTTIAATNITKTSGGADLELDSRYRERIKLAPNKYSVAGSSGAYKYWALTANPSIIDAAVISPRRIRVEVYPLLDSGLPGTEILEQVEDVLSAETIRPLTDIVSVLQPVESSYIIDANVTLLATADPQALAVMLQSAAEAYAQERRSRLGLDIVPSQLVAALSLSGVYRVELLDPPYIEVTPSQWANCTFISINIVGVVDG